MTRRFLWIPVLALLAMAAMARPWSAGAAEARPAKVARCSADEVSRLRVELAETKALLAESQLALMKTRAQLVQLLDLEKARAKKLADQLGSPMIETLKP